MGGSSYLQFLHFGGIYPYNSSNGWVKAPWYDLCNLPPSKLELFSGNNLMVFFGRKKTGMCLL